eukprot:CAMPEP_0197581736 /NCGR_PEP_ID=MMETSP1326-20131121/5153_1 /TAXON_ID=1155430 /ORGANISM="Genus nov. species nov., Strain RCC2288" /LENGTH=461 /DNA_ID=CAMNT_0043145683 /DNA_START=67 /DNA_END=1452 /DNA_ORIENTATION=-
MGKGAMGGGAMGGGVSKDFTAEVNSLNKRLAALEGGGGLAASSGGRALMNSSMSFNEHGDMVNMSLARTASGRVGIGHKDGMNFELAARRVEDLPAFDTAFQRGDNASEGGKPWKVIDCHLHLMDFLQKSEGTYSMMAANNHANVSKSVVFGMPCCKKWEQQEPEAPLYYQDDNSDCYVYHYADQMVADGWQGLPEQYRSRFAPCFASFNPTDKFAIQHVMRMHNKYPGMWRSVGEVMCRHDDLTTMLQDKECPTANHPGLKPIYEFCVENDMPVIIHHNSTQMMEEDGTWEYLWEVEDVLQAYPTLKFVWAHCGVSRRISEPDHHKMCDAMLRKYPNLYLDMSWVVWEDVICGPDGYPKQEWLQVIERHQDNCLIGSDTVGQFEGKLHKEITKYYKLLDRLSTTAAQKVGYGNCDRIFFQQTLAAPSLDDVAKKYPRITPTLDAERLIDKEGKFLHIGKY